MTPLRQKKSRIGVLFLALVLVIALALPLPFVIFRPGTPENVLGSMITVPQSYANLDLKSRDEDGQLFLTTVFVTTPRSKVFGAEILRAWIRGDEAVYPRDAIYPQGQDAKQIKSQEQFEMASSQQYAIYNALSFLGFKVPTEARVVEMLEESDAVGKIEIDDVIRRVDGKEVASSSEIVTIVRSKSPGDSITMEVERDGVIRTVREIRLIENPQGAAVGLFLVVDFDSPVPISIDIRNTGGPSAGMIFALGIIEKMTEEDLLRGRKIAGSGTIDLDGRVGAIGGIEAKLIGARRKGATIFLASVNNCDDIAHIPDGLQVIPVSTLRDAVEVLRDPDPSDRPTCSSSQ